MFMLCSKFSGPVTITLIVFSSMLAACGGGGGGNENSPPPVSSSSSSSSSIAATLSFVTGGIGGVGNVDGVGTAARFYYPSGVAVDSLGNAYVADSSGMTIRKVDAAGVVTTFAGQTLAPGSSDGVGTQAAFYGPSAIAVDGAGTLYVVERTVKKIRKITSAGVVTTLASGLTDPKEIAVDAGGSNIYVTDRNAILKITAAGVVTTLAGSVSTAGFADATGAAARFDFPYGLALTPSNTLLVADYNNHRIRQVTQAGVVTTFAGTGTAGISNGSASTATFYRPQHMTIDSLGNYFVTSNASAVIRKLTSAGDVTTFMQTADWAGAIAIGPANTLLVITYGSLLYKVTTDGTATLFAGSPELTGTADGTGDVARFSGAYGFTPDSSGNIYLADEEANTIRKITPAGVVTTYAGSTNFNGRQDGPINAATFTGPQDIAIDSFGNMYVADANNQLIRKISAGQVSTFAGSGAVGSTDGLGIAAQFKYPTSLTTDASGNLYIVDYGHTIRKVTPAGQVTTLAGNASNIVDESSTPVDGAGASALFMYVTDIVYASDGNLYVHDWNTIRKITLAGVVTTVAGAYDPNNANRYVDGVGTAARFDGATGMAADNFGNLYIADTGNNVIRKLSLQTNAVSTVVGIKNTMGFKPGPTPGALAGPQRLAISGNTLYITMDNAMVKVTPLP